MRTILRYGLVVLVSAGLFGGCAGKSKFQDKMKGLWVLKSRTLPDGTEIAPPAISGRMEWFPMDVDAETAHVSILTTYAGTDLQIAGAHYDIEGTDRFTCENYLEVGGGISKNPDKGYRTTKSADTGTITVEGGRITFQHGKGHAFVFEGSKLTIRHPDGTMDLLLK
jgi:hypothetical protein